MLIVHANDKSHRIVDTNSKVRALDCLLRPQNHQSMRVASDYGSYKNKKAFSSQLKLALKGSGGPSSREVDQN